MGPIELPKAASVPCQRVAVDVTRVEGNVAIVGDKDTTTLRVVSKKSAVNESSTFLTQ
jgi:hypothetical protein